MMSQTILQLIPYPGDRIIVKSKKTDAKVIGKDTESGLDEIAYPDSESNTWEGSANLTHID